METLARSLGLVNKHFSEFSAHLHILDLYNVPLAEGECMVKWRFKGSIHLNSATNAAVIKDALDGTKAYLKGKGPAVDSDEDTNEESVTYRKAEVGSPPTSPGSHAGINHANASHRKTSGSAASGLASLKDAILHPKRHNRPRTSGAGRETVRANDHAPTAADSRPLDDDDEFPPNTQGRNPLSMSKSPKPFLSPTFTRGSGDYPFSSLSFPDMNHSSQYDSRENESAIHRSPTRKAGPSNSGASPSRTNTSHAPNDSLSRTSTVVGLERSLSISLDRDEERQRLRTSTSTDLPERTQSKGNTGLVPLNCSSHSCHFDQHVICAVQIPLDKASGALQPSSVKLSVRHKVRITPLPKATSTQLSPSIGVHNNDGNAASSSSVSLNSPGQSSSSLSSHHRRADVTNIKEEHEEIHLGDINLDLSEFVSLGLSTKSKERWVSRRYLLVNGKTNALLRVAVKMDWIGGERTFRAPPLRSGQINPKQKRNGNSANQSTHHHVNSSSNLSSMAHSNTSSRSVNTVNSAKPASNSESNAPTGRLGKRKGKEKSGAIEQDASSATNTARDEYDPAAALYSTTDQATIDLIEAIFADSIGYRGSSALLSQKTGLTDRQEAEQLKANAHGEKRGSSGTGAKALRDANIHHDLSKPPHSGYHTSSLYEDNQNHHPHHHKHHPDQPVLIRIPTAAQAITSTKTFSPSASQQNLGKTSPSKTKRLMSSNYPSSASLVSRTEVDASSSSKGQNSQDAGSLLKRPLLRTRTVSSSSSIRSIIMKASPNLGSKATFTPITKVESPEQPLQRPPVPESDHTQATSTSVGYLLDDTRAQAATANPDPSGSAASSLEPDGQDADKTDSSLPNVSPDRRSILTTSTRHESGASSPVRSKGVRWEDPPAVDKEQIDSILQHVARKQEERELARESLSRTPSTRSASSSRQPSPERLKIPSAESASSSRSNSSEISRVEDLRERGLLPNLTINGVRRRLSDEDG